MRIAFVVAVLFALLLGHTPAPAIEISFLVSDAGDTNLNADHPLRYTYFISGLTLLANQELDFRFDPDLYGSLTNGVAGPGFDVLLLQPDNPPGAFGDFSVLALVDHSPLFLLSVDFTFIGAGTPGAQPFFINEYDQSGKFVGTIESGFTVAAIPEPGSLALGGTGLLVGGFLWALRRRFPGTA